MEDTTSAPMRPRHQPARRTRRPLVALLLAAVAVAGIGAAATTAAWTGNVTFLAAANAGSVNLGGSLDGTTFSYPVSGDTVTITVPVTVFQNMVPGETRTVPLYVKNNGSIDLATSATVAPSGDLFTPWPVTDPDTQLDVTLDPVGVVGALAAGAVEDFTLTVTAPDDWDTSYQNKTGSITVTVTGQTVPTV